MLKLINKILNLLFGIQIGKEAAKAVQLEEKKDDGYSIERAAEILYKHRAIGHIEISNALMFHIMHNGLKPEDPNNEIVVYANKLEDEFVQSNLMVPIKCPHEYPGYQFSGYTGGNYAEKVFFSQSLSSEDNPSPKTLRVSGVFYNLVYNEEQELVGIQEEYYYTAVDLSAKAQKELIQATIKARNLHDRFTGTLHRIVLVPLNENNEYIMAGVADSIGLAIEYELLDETRYFMAYYKSNMLKKKLNGAAITADELTKKYTNAICSINEYWRTNGSNLYLKAYPDDPSKTSLNEKRLFANTDKPRYALMNAIVSEDFCSAMTNLMKHDIYIVKVGNTESQLAMDPKLTPEGLIEFKPVFKSDAAILAVSIAATKINSRLPYVDRS